MARRAYRNPTSNIERQALVALQQDIIRQINDRIDLLELSLAQVSELVYGSNDQQTAINKLLSGEGNPTLITLLRYSHALNCTLKINLEPKKDRG